MHVQGAAVALDDEADALDAVAVVLLVVLEGDGQAVFKADGGAAVIFQADAQKAALDGGVEADDAVLGVLFAQDAFDGVVERVAEQGGDIDGLHEGEAFAVDHIGEADAVLFTQKALFGEDGVQRLVARLGDVAVDHHRLFDVGDGMIPPLRAQVAKGGYLVLQVVALDVDEVDGLFGIGVLPPLAAQDLFQNHLVLLVLARQHPLGAALEHAELQKQHQGAAQQRVAAV